MQYDVAIIGGGFAGLSCGYHLAAQGVRCVVLERNATCGAESSGRNAAMARQFVPDPLFAHHAIQGTRWLYEPPAAVADAPLLTACGSMIRYAAAQMETITQQMQRAQTDGLASALIRPAEAAQRSAFAEDWTDGVIVWTPTDGVVDLPRLTSGLLRGLVHHGGICVTNAQVTAIARQDKIWTLATSSGAIESRYVVNAAGAWADTIAGLAGATPRGCVPYRRHLFVTIPDATVDPAGPFVWDDVQKFYIRPCEGGVMLCICDEDAVAPETTDVVPAVAQQLRTYLQQYLPQYADAPFARSWNGVRTYTADRQLQYGWDAIIPEFFWIAGLGGHGVASSPSIGYDAAIAILQQL